MTILSPSHSHSCYNLMLSCFQIQKNADKGAFSSRPYLNVKAYEAANFDWMNITVTEGRLPENDREIVISEAAQDDGATIAVGAKISARFFERKITGLSKETIFPFYSLSGKDFST